MHNVTLRTQLLSAAFYATIAFCTGQLSALESYIRETQIEEQIILSCPKHGECGRSPFCCNQERCTYCKRYLVPYQDLKIRYIRCASPCGKSLVCIRNELRSTGSSCNWPEEINCTCNGCICAKNLVIQTQHLFNAVECGNLPGVENALASGADISGRNINFQTPLHVATNDHIIKFLLKTGNIDFLARDNQGRMPIHCVAQHGDIESMLTILNHSQRVDLQILDKNFNTPLHYAASGSNHEVVRYLLMLGANAHARNSSGKIPLHHVATLDVAQELIPYTDDVLVRDNEGCTVLCCLVKNHTSNDQDELIKIIHALVINKGVNNIGINCTDKDRTSPLLWAIKNGYDYVSCYLIDLGADIDTKNTANTSPLSAALAAHWINKDDAQRLINYLARTSVHFNELNKAIYFGHLETAELLINRGADTNKKESLGIYHSDNYKEVRPLHIAAQKGYTCMVRKLIAHGARVNAKDYHHWTPLEYATYYNHTDTVRVLTRAGGHRAQILDRSSTKKALVATGIVAGIGAIGYCIVNNN